MKDSLIFLLNMSGKTNHLFAGGGEERIPGKRVIPLGVPKIIGAPFGSGGTEGINSVFLQEVQKE